MLVLKTTQHEVVIEGNVQLRSLVFVDLDFEEIGDGYTSYRVKQEGDVERIAASNEIPLMPSDLTVDRGPDVIG